MKTVEIFFIESFLNIPCWACSATVVISVICLKLRPCWSIVVSYATPSLPEIFSDMRILMNEWI